MSWHLLERQLTSFTQWAAFLGFTLLLLIALFTVFDVFMRGLFHAPFAGVLDVSRALLPVVIAACFPIAILQRRHVTIRFLGKALGHRMEAYLELFGSTVLLLFLGLMAWQFVHYTADLQAAGEHTWVIQMPLSPWWWITTAVMASCVPLQGLIVLSCLIQAVMGRSSDGSQGQA